MTADAAATEPLSQEDFIAALLSTVPEGTTDALES